MGFSNRRVARITILLAILGTAFVTVKFGIRDAAGFAVGAALSYLSYRSWVRLAETVGTGKAPATGSALFLAMRYLLIGAAIYVMIKLLGSNPGALIVGLLVSFTALALERLWGAVSPK